MDTAIPEIVEQHAEDAAHLRRLRSVVARSPQAKLIQLKQLDDRLLAHLDGLEIAGEVGRARVQALLASPGVGEVFTATVLALQRKSAPDLHDVLTLVDTLPAGSRGVSSAFGWVSAQDLRGTIRDLLGSGDASRKRIAIQACALHGVTPGPALRSALSDEDQRLRAAALIASSRLGRTDLLPAVEAALGDVDPDVRFQAARSGLLLGDRGAAIGALRDIAAVPGVHRHRAVLLLMAVLSLAQCGALLKSLSREAGSMRLLIQAIGAGGDPQFIPWLIERTQEARLSRLAGESITLITGLDVELGGSRRPAPVGLEFGPSEDPEDGNVAMDEDDGLPWPDPERLVDWWQANGSRFASGKRHFMGRHMSIDSCREVLVSGRQRQRTVAACHRSLLQPGSIFFDTSAPSWRQLRWLASSA